MSGWLATTGQQHGGGGKGDDNEQLNEMMDLDPGGLDGLILHHELRRRFPDRIWTFDDDDGRFVVVSVSAADRAELELEESDTDLANRYVDLHRGFSKVIAAIAAAKRFLIGHNCGTDLQLIFRQFIGDVPADYSVFKAELHQLLPVLFDTKHMAAAEAKRRPRQVEAGMNLARLYEALMQQGDRDDDKQSCAPSVELTEECAR